MLQQTRVAAVIGHYHEFLRRFPTVEKLAAAREASVLAAWSGLGYYRRARMLHAAAKAIVRQHGGEFPSTAEGLQTLPGIGRYTAAAIASITFEEPVAVVDGNVERVLQRVTGKRLAAEELWEAASEMLDAKLPGDFNQAMMELGATVCTPRRPGCSTCPVVELCATRGELNGGSKAAPQKRREIHYVLDSRDGAVFLLRRARDARLMAGMWELPEIAAPSGAKDPSDQESPIAALKRCPPPKRIPFGKLRACPEPSEGAGSRWNDKDRVPGACEDHQEPLFTLRHSITVTDYTVRVWRVAAPSRSGGKWIPLERLGRLALTGLARKILRRAGVL